MTSPRTPRQLLGWTVPEHVHFSADEEHRDAVYLDCSKHENWPFTTVESGDSDPVTRVGHFLRDHAHGEQIEYRPLSEVLPETPEPTGTQGCNAQSSWNGNHEIKYCARPVGHPGEHRSSLVSEWDTLKWRDDDDPVPASQSVPAVPVSSTGGKETGEAAETATAALKGKPLASEPRTRDAVLARVIEEANEQVDDDWTTADTLAFREYFGERLATRLAEAGLLADPAQTTELLSPEVSQTILQLGRDLAAARRAQVVAEEREQAAERRETLRQGERDRLSLLLRGMARKLVAYRKWTLGDDVPAVHRLRRELAEATEINQEWQRYKQRKIAERRQLEAERDERQARIDAALAELDASSPPPRLRWIRAALQGDQPTDSKEQS